QEGAGVQVTFAVAALEAQLGKLDEAVQVCLTAKTAPENQARHVVNILHRYQGRGLAAKNQGLWEEQVAVVTKFLEGAASSNPGRVQMRLLLADLDRKSTRLNSSH